VWSLIAQTVDLVVHVDLVRNQHAERVASRRVTAIIEVGGVGESGGLATTELWSADPDGVLTQRAPMSARHLARLRAAGYDTRAFTMAGG
jgi:pilus assembly protein CpaF